MNYGSQEGTYNLQNSPTYTDAGTYTVYYQVTMSNYTTVTGSKTVEISKANITPTVALEGWTYGTTANTPHITGNTGNGHARITLLSSYKKDLCFLSNGKCYAYPFVRHYLLLILTQSNS